MYNKYKYHQEILVYLNDKNNEYKKLKESNKKLNESNETKGVVTNNFYDNYCFPEWISEDLKIDVYKVKESLVDLNELGFIDYKDFKYSSKERTSTYIDAKYFKTKRSEYVEKKIINSFKNVIVIILGVFSIYTFIMSQINHDKPTNTLLIQLQSEVKSIQAEQVELKRIQKMILNDSLTIKNP
tara:strand:- start:496 stop:1047 length:552 start_codon:yes stop_codon:yes gene_type:complete